MVLAMPIDHPVFPVGADLQLEGGDVVRLLSLFGNGPLGGNARQNFQEVEVNLEERGKGKIESKICYVFLMENIPWERSNCKASSGDLCTQD